MKNCLYVLYIYQEQLKNKITNVEFKSEKYSGIEPWLKFVYLEFLIRFIVFTNNV